MKSKDIIRMAREVITIIFWVSIILLLLGAGAVFSVLRINP